MNKQMTQHTTIADVAKAAGVSADYRFTATINGRYDKMHQQRGNGVEKAIKDLHVFQLASVAWNPQTPLVTLSESSLEIFLTPFILTAKGIDDVLQQAGYDILLMNTEQLTGKESRALQRLYQQRVDGIILSSLIPATFSQFALLSTNDIPLVIVDREVDDRPMQLARSLVTRCLL